MARIPEQEIERLKKDISLERLVTARGITLKRHGSNLLGLCPFHDDREPSLSITPDTNLWHCLGACQMGGSVIDWVMKVEKTSFRHAVELLRGDIPSFAAVSSSTSVRLPPVLEPSVEDAVLLRQVVDFYTATLKESPEAKGYLEQRGLMSGEMIDRFKLGFANRTLAYRLPEKGRKAGVEQRERLQRLGVMRESGHEHFNGSIVIPIFDAEGRVSEMYGRKVTSGLRPGTPLHLYLPGPHRGVFNVEALSSSTEVILCEALIDALTFWCAGFRNVTSSYGVEGFTDDHREAFKRHKIEVVRIAYDRDEAGDRAAAKLGEELNAMGIETYRVLFPKGMDANEYAMKMSPPAKALDLVLRHAEWMGKGRTTSTSVPMNVEPAAVEVVHEVADDDCRRVIEPVVKTEVAPNIPLPSLAAALFSLSPAIGGDEGRRGRAELRPETVACPRAQEEPEPRAAQGERAGVERGERALLRGHAGDVRGEAESGLLQAGEPRAGDRRGGHPLRFLGHVLIELERRQEEQIQEALKPKELTLSMSEAERDEALDLLRDPQLLERVARDIGRCGVVGEEVNKMVGYLAATSRKLEAPLGVVIQSSSAAGKTSLMDGVLSLMPEEHVVQFSAMTGQSLFYMGESDPKHKVLAVVEERGAERASYALKLLQSEGELTIASTGKDPVTGKLVTMSYRVEGPVTLILTTTAIEIDEELLNRCIVLTVDEGREQTRAIHELQRTAQTLDGLLARQD